MAKKTSTASEKIEREYVIPLRVEWRKVPRYKRANKAVRAIREFLVQHMKIYDRDLKKIKIDRYLNEAVWFRGIKKPPAKIKVRAVRDGENVKVELVNYTEKLKFKKDRESKAEAKARESVEKKRGLIQKAREGLKGKSEERKTEEEKVRDSERKEEEKEKKSAVVESGQKMEKEIARQMKHQVGGKTKEPKRQKRMALQK